MIAHAKLGGEHEYPELERTAREIGRLIEAGLADAKARDPKIPENIGFALFVFEFGPGAWAWVSNGERETMLDALEEFLTRNGRPR